MINISYDLRLLYNILYKLYPSLNNITTLIPVISYQVTPDPHEMLTDTWPLELPEGKIYIPGTLEKITALVLEEINQQPIEGLALLQNAPALFVISIILEIGRSQDMRDLFPLSMLSSDEAFLAQLEIIINDQNGPLYWEDTDGIGWTFYTQVQELKKRLKGLA